MQHMFSWMIILILLSFLFFIDKFEPISNVLEGMQDYASAFESQADCESDSSSDSESDSNNASIVKSDNHISPKSDELMRVNFSGIPISNSVDKCDDKSFEVDPPFNSKMECGFDLSNDVAEKHVQPHITKRRKAPDGYVYLSDQYWKIPDPYENERAQKSKCPLNASPTIGMPIDSLEYKRGIGTIMPDFAFKTL